MFVEPKLRDAPLLLAFQGWNDAGEAASAALRYVSEQIGTAPLAEVDAEAFFDFTVARPSLARGARGEQRVEWPHTRFHFGSMDPERELVIGVGPEPHLRWRAYCEELVELIRRLALPRVVFLGGYLVDVVYSRPVVVTGFASDPNELEAHGIGDSGYEGPTGIVGVLCERLSREGVEFTSLWAGLPHYISVTPNPRGSLALLERLAPLVGLRLDLDPLRAEAARFEERVSTLVASDPELCEYVRQLKRRDFSQ